jgi:KaiC/GvpD/RAD55 family RecA-like ATPase
MVEKLETGMETLDRELNGGLPAGSITLLEVPPGSQGHLFLHELTATRGTLWMSFARTAEAVKRSLEETPSPSGECTVKYISGTDPMDEVEKLLSAVPDQSNIIFDPINMLEQQGDERRFRRFLNELQAHLLETESLAFFYATQGTSNIALRDKSKYFADVVFELETVFKDDEVENFLRVPKYRRGHCPSGVIKMDLTSEVSIDISRDIA